MENLDLIILNILVVICFIAFFISTFKAFEYASKLDNPESNSRSLFERLKTYLNSLFQD
jgi:hypothetical protein